MSKKLLKGLILSLLVNFQFTTLNAHSYEFVELTSYTIKKGDTLESISKKYNITKDELLEMNSILNPNIFKQIEVLMVPVITQEEKDDTNTIHNVISGDTLNKISRLYNVSIEKIAAHNNIKETDVLQIDQKISIPTKNITSRNGRGIREQLASRSIMSTNREIKETKIWPITDGQISSHYGRRGYRFHQGVDISAHYGTEIYSAMKGEVIYAGWKNGYGRTIEIQHEDNLITRYAHLSRYNVTVGKEISSGDLIGFVGTSGRSTGPHLHFEVLIEGKTVNPISYFQN